MCIVEPVDAPPVNEILAITDCCVKKFKTMEWKLLITDDHLDDNIHRTLRASAAPASVVCYAKWRLIHFYELPEKKYFKLFFCLYFNELLKAATKIESTILVPCMRVSLWLSYTCGMFHMKRPEDASADLIFIHADLLRLNQVQLGTCHIHNAFTSVG